MASGIRSSKTGPNNAAVELFRASTFITNNSISCPESKPHGLLDEQNPLFRPSATFSRKGRRYTVPYAALRAGDGFCFSSSTFRPLK
jgi:hypothetical protein